MGGKILFFSAFLIPLMGLNGLLISMIQGTNCTRKMVLPVLISIAFKAILAYPLLVSFSFLGVIISSSISYIIVIASSLYVLHQQKLVRYHLIIVNASRILLISLLSLLVSYIVKTFFPMDSGDLFKRIIYLFLHTILYASFYFFMIRKLWQKTP